MSSNKEKCVICGEETEHWVQFYDNIYSCYDHYKLVETKINEVLTKLILEGVDSWI